MVNDDAAPRRLLVSGRPVARYWGVHPALVTQAEKAGLLTKHVVAKDTACAFTAHVIVNVLFDWWERKGRPTTSVELPHDSPVPLLRAMEAHDVEQAKAKIVEALTPPLSPKPEPSP